MWLFWLQSYVMKTVVVGCSLNPEIHGVFADDSSKEKLPLLGFDLSFSGSSANVANALRACGCPVGLFGLVGPHSKKRDLLLLAAKWSGLPLPHLLEVLTETNLAFLPIDISKSKNKVAGVKGEIVDEKVLEALTSLHQFVDGHKNAFGVMTGFRREEFPFGQAVLERTAVGQRVLCPRDVLCSDPAFKPFLRTVDCLVVNEIEFGSAGGNVEQLLACGPRVVVVTRGKNGGECYVRDESTVTYEPYVLTDMESPGTGDWFLGSLIACITMANETFLTAQPDVIQKAARFAARVAGQKAVIPGAANGPSEELIRQLLCEM